MYRNDANDTTSQKRWQADSLNGLAVLDWPVMRYGGFLMKNLIFLHPIPSLRVQPGQQNVQERCCQTRPCLGESAKSVGALNTVLLRQPSLFLPEEYHGTPLSDCGSSTSAEVANA